jgi:hypothetical protein
LIYLFAGLIIGENAGLMWEALRLKNGQTLSALKKNAKEDKIKFEAKGKQVKISLL